MIISHQQGATAFVYCTIHQSKNERSTYVNEGDGHYHQAMYVVEGEAALATVQNEEGGEVIESWGPRPADTLYDISHTKGKFLTTLTEDSSITWMAFNPIPADKVLQIEIGSDSRQFTVSAQQGRVTIVGIIGEFTVNGQPLAALQHAKAFAGKDVTIEVPEGKYVRYALVRG